MRPEDQITNANGVAFSDRSKGSSEAMLAKGVRVSVT